MTTDTRSLEDMKTDPLSTSIFHSDLPYIFVKDRFTVDSYVAWGDTSGGRTFALSSDLIDYKAANPDRAFLMVIEESDGKQSIVNPMLQADSVFDDTENGITTANATCAINGCDYLFAFTTSDSQLSAITRGNSLITGSINLVYRPWDVGDTRVTIFRAPFGEYTIPFGTIIQSSPRGSELYFIDSLSDGRRFGRDLVSIGNDCVKVHFIFLNIQNSVDTFDRLPDYTGGAINIEIDDFTVGGVNMLENTPLISRGTFNSGDTVTPIIGKPLGSRVAVFSSSQMDLGFTSSTNVVSANNTPVIEIPSEFTPAQTMQINFKDKFIRRDGTDIFTTTTAAAGLRIIGTKEIEFTPATGSITEFMNSFVTLSSTQTGTITGADANTIYLASTVYDDQKLLSSTIMTVGDNPIFNIFGYYQKDSSNPDDSFSFGAFFLITIASDGTVSARCYRRSANYSASVVSVGFTFGAFKVRLIALDASTP
jgi:hypothetical protein